MKSGLFVAFFALLSLSFSGFCENNPVIQKSPLDTREYAAITLENGLKVIVVSDKASPTAGAALIVKAGLYDDPKEYPGLAHFLEHMLFLGTKKSPIPDEFQNYMQAHGGDRNAMTEMERTSYYFSIQPEAFGPALERFADFFVSPMLYPKYIDRELNAVDQEFHLFLHKDNWAAFEVNKETSNQAHPNFRYFGGNMETLGKDKKNLPKALRVFFTEHYHAGNMTLALVGPQSTQELLTFAKQHFSSIAKTPESYHFDRARPHLYSTQERGLDIYMKAKGETQSLTITFPLDVEDDLTKRKSKQFVASVLGHDGKGGLSLGLKRAKWILETGASYESLSREQDALVLSFMLTDDGLKHIDDITRHVFSYISMLKKTGIPEYYFSDTKAIQQCYFLYIEKQEAANLAMALASNLHEMPAGSVITGGFILPNDAISKKAIQQVLSQLKPQNMRRMIISPNVKGDKESKWYKASYRVSKIGKDKMALFSQAPRFSTFKLPPKNRFLPADLKLAKKPGVLLKEPQKVREDTITLWHYQDTEFGQPKGSILINFHAPWVAGSPQSILLAKMYCQMVMDSLHDEFYAAGLAGASISLSEHSRGITLSVSGYSDKQVELLRDVLKEIKAFSLSSSQFVTTKDMLIHELKDFDQNTLSQKAQVELRTLLFAPSFHPEELLSASKTLTKAQLEDFKAVFWKGCHVEMLVHGNYDQNQAKQFAAVVDNIFPAQAVDDKIKSGIKIANLKGKLYRKISTTDKNHVVMWYLQNKNKDYDTLAKTMLLSNLMEVPYFQTLRVEKQLAYSLGSGPYNLKKVSGLLFWIQSAKAEPKELLNEIKGFLTQFENQLVKMNENDFVTSKEALVTQIRQRAQTLGEQTSRWWGVIQNGDTDFTHPQKLADAIEKVDRAELVLFTRTWLAEQSQQGQLFVLSGPLSPLANEKEIASVKKFREDLSYAS